MTGDQIAATETTEVCPRCEKGTLNFLVYTYADPTTDRCAKYQCTTCPEFWIWYHHEKDTAIQWAQESMAEMQAHLLECKRAAEKGRQRVRREAWQLVIKEIEPRAPLLASELRAHKEALGVLA